MAMYGTSSMLILVSIMFISVIALSTAHQITDNDIKHLCSKTGHLGGCYNLLKSDHRTTNVDEKGLAEVSIDLASHKAKKIHSLLHSLAKTTRDSRLRNIYNLCSKNYDDAIRDLEVAKNNSFVISIALILAITIPSSLGHREHHRHHHKHHHREHDREKSNMEQELRDLCSNTHNSKECWNIIKPKLDRFDDDNWRGVAVAAIDLAMEKADQIHDQLNGLHRDSSDDKLKDKYMTCSKNYNDAHHNQNLSSKSVILSKELDQILI